MSAWQRLIGTLSMPAMARLVGVFALVIVLYGTILLSDPTARSADNHLNLGRRIGYWGVLTLGAGLVIVTGGIDLSIGSVVGLSAVCFGLLLEKRVSPTAALVCVLLGAFFIGLFHGLLVTKLRLQPFIVTLCGLFIYRGLAQCVTLIDFDALTQQFTSLFRSAAVVIPRTSSRTVGIGGRPDLDWLRFFATGKWLGIPMTLWLLAGLAVVFGLLLHRTVYGRYLYALGYNEQAARYAGVSTDRYKTLAYVLCALLGGAGGVLFLLDLETASPSGAGQWFELYAITGAVLGGCSLRGGEGTVAGILLGTAVLPLLKNLCIFVGIPSDLEYTVIGMALLLGTIADELLKRRAARREARVRA